MLNIEVFQIKSSSQLKRNLKKITNLIKTSQAEILLFPELALTGYKNIKSYSKKSIKDALSTIQKNLLENQYLFIGAPSYKDDKIYNSIYLITSKDLKVVAEKKLLFPEIDNIFSSGKKRDSLKIKDFKIGIVICFELRSPEIFRGLIKQGVNIIFVFAQWPTIRINHWKSLLKARAIENQCYVLGVNALGYSAFFSPKGELLNKPLKKETSFKIKLTYSKENLAYPLKTPYLKLEKVKSLKDLKDILNTRRKKGQVVVFTNGCFDILHAGHVDYLQKARELGDILIVGLNSDRSIKQLKGVQRPVNPEEFRANVLSALECVDYVIIFDEETPENLIKEIRPDILVKGADWTEDKIIGANFVKSYGGKVVRIKFSYNISTTKIIEKIKQSH